MIGAYASLLIVLLLAALIGQALLAISSGASREEPGEFSWLAPPLGVAALLVLAGAAARLPGEGVAALVVILAAAVAALWFLRGRVRGLIDALSLAAPVVAITTLAASIPFIVAGNVGILGAGLLNDDMASHLLIADYVAAPEGYVPTFIRGGYPIGPHAVVVALSEGTGAGLVEVFGGFTLALAPLTGLLALGLLDGLSRPRRILGACLVALSYLGISYVAQGAFKEPLQAMILIVFAVLLANLIGLATSEGVKKRAYSPVPPILRVMPLAVLAAASVFNYSLPGLLWIGAVGGAVIAARFFLIKPRPELPANWKRQVAPYAVGALIVLAAATAQEWGRIADFSRLDALNPDRFGSDIGNLKQAINPLEVFGIWPTGDYRTAAGNAGPPALAFWLGGLFALAAFGLGLREVLRRGLYALPAVLGAILLVWAVTAAFSTPYLAAKALAIAAPVVMLIAARGLLALDGVRLAIGLAFIAAAGLSSFIALRQAPVGPDAHATELAEVREEVQGEPVLFLGRDNFIAWELRGSDEVTGVVANFFSVEEVRQRFQKGEGGGEKFDVDAVFPFTLENYRYILATRGGPSSSPPPRLVPAVETENYVLYERTGEVGKRKTFDEGREPGTFVDCDDERLRAQTRGKGTAQIWTTPPVFQGEVKWEPDPDPTDGNPSSQTLKLKPGTWQISLAYDSRRALIVKSPELGIDTRIDPNLDFRGPTPTFPVAEVEVEQKTTATVTVEPVEPNLAGRLLGAPNEAHLRQLTATPLGVIERVQKRRACYQYVDWYRSRGSGSASGQDSGAGE